MSSKYITIGKHYIEIIEFKSDDEFKLIYMNTVNNTDISILELFKKDIGKIFKCAPGRTCKEVFKDFSKSSKIIEKFLGIN